ncbi:hypothetical protein [Sphingomicrobium astaxanthinifaciens]|uniref:hypothetical protein n=1 Tax=Sphingomicrobium astaxanthinifaciens TaxID=1227949 RepID=UPI001FCC529E|nr:hypothetical protein [Sphingomicrobium astaxanthinifaciens]MCJ7421247.1 hypothetical protein [Sphingomicrobium astaxanthinifaciens]
MNNYEEPPMHRLILPALLLAATAACGNTETDTDVALDPTPDVEELRDVPDDYEPRVVNEEEAMTTVPAEDPDMSETEPDPAAVD